MKKILSLAVLIGITISCSDHEIKETESISSESSYELVSLSENFWNPISEDTKIPDNIGKYEGYFSPTDYITTISSSKRNPLESENINVYFYQNDSDMLTKSPDDIPELEIKIDGQCIDEFAILKTKSGHPFQEAASLFGRRVPFMIGSRTKSGASESTIELYVPELIQITSPEVKIDSDIFPLCYYDGFVLKWNPDSDNTNGVIVVVEWFGTMVFGEDNLDSYVRHVDLLPDNGEAVLNNHLFDDIPDTALCHLTIIRGDLENLIVDDASHKIIGETHATLPFVLIREIANN